MRKLIAIALLAGVASSPVFSQSAGTVVRPMEYHGVSPTFYELALQQAPLAAAAGLLPATEMVQKHGPLITEAGVAPRSSRAPALAPKPFMQTETPRPLAAVAGANFEGPGVGMPGFILTGAPPDTTLAVGPSHIVAYVNTMFAVMSKTGTVLSLANGNTLFTGLGNVCETTNRGDPLVLYDRLADRWLISQFAFNVSGGSILAPYLQCIAISTTNNPLGSYHRYTISFGSVAPDGFNDYGKVGVFHDGYYTAYNIFGGSPAGGFTGVALCASDRTKMLAGDPTATTLCAPTAVYAGGGSFLPGDVDGTTAPTTTTQGNIFVRYSFGGVSLRFMKMKPNFAAGTLTLTDGFGGAHGSFVNIPVGPTTVACNGFAGNCVPQPGTTNTLDTLADRLMYRAAMRNRNGVESLVVTQSIDPDGAGSRAAALRWYEVRQPFAAAPVLFQNANFNPDAHNRWMGSMAMDKMGNIMIGYSVASSTMFPSLAVTGRLRSDVRNQLRAEQIYQAGGGSQTGTLRRWGDYTTMQLDPVDECTFWYIGQYLASSGAFNWRTRIGSFKFNGCN